MGVTGASLEDLLDASAPESGSSTSLISYSILPPDVSEVADASNNTSTSYTMSVDQVFSGTISPGDPGDWISINLVAGQSYVFLTWGVGGSAAGLADPTMSIRDSSGAQLAFNDDIFPGRSMFSGIEFTATYSGTYYIQVQGYGSNTGNYHVMAADESFSVEQVATYLTEIDWGLTTPFYFNTPSGQITVNLTELTAAGQQLARWALEAWSIATGITFVETASDSAQIIFDDNQQGAFAGPLSINPVNGVNGQSIVNVGTAWLNTYGTTIDSYSFQTYLHEIGHAMGFGHGGPYNGSATFGVDNLYINDSVLMSVMSYFFQNNNPNVQADPATIVSLMPADLVAAHSLYGPTTAYSGNTVWGANSNVGGTMGALMAAVFDGTPVSASFYSGGPIAFTIFDTGGNDTLDLSPVTVAQRIDLTPGALSDVNGVDGSLVIATNTIIENVISGSGNDQITGHAAKNRLTGGQGNDTIDGGAGIDTAVLNVSSGSISVSQSGNEIIIVSADGTDHFTNVEFFEFTDGTVSADDLFSTPGVNLPGTPGPDTLIGGANDDTISGFGGDDRLEGRAGHDSIDGGDDNDLLLGQDGNDTLIGGNGNDTLYGGAGADEIYGGFGDDSAGGGTGSDTMFGEAGNDTLNGGAGNDSISGGGGNDEINGGTGDDALYGDAENDLIYGGTGNDTAGGGTGSDTIHGEGGHDSLAGGGGHDSITGGGRNDTISGGAGNDTIYGDVGADLIYGGSGNDSVGGGSGADTINGEAGHDTLNGGGGNDRINGGSGNDSINGGSGNDTINGNNGNDRIDGGSGSDNIDGGSGNDTMDGGAGVDTFVFTAFNSGETDLIENFEDGIDQLVLYGISGADPQARVDALNITDTASGVTMSYNGHVINLTGVTAADLSVDDFIFL